LVCDLTPKLGELAERYCVKPTPDGQGFFGYPPAGFFMEVVSFSKLLLDARRRNQRLFDLLGFRTSIAPAVSKPMRTVQSFQRPAESDIQIRPRPFGPNTTPPSPMRVMRNNKAVCSVPI